MCWSYVCCYQGHAWSGPPSLLLIASTITCPLGGLFNILVFTRPSVWILALGYSLSCWLPRLGGTGTYQMNFAKSPLNKWRGPGVPRECWAFSPKEEHLFCNIPSLEPPPIDFGHIISTGIQVRSQKEVHFQGRINSIATILSYKRTQ